MTYEAVWAAEKKVRYSPRHIVPPPGLAKLLDPGECGFFHDFGYWPRKENGVILSEYLVWYSNGKVYYRERSTRKITKAGAYAYYVKRIQRHRLIRALKGEVE